MNADDIWTQAGDLSNVIVHLYFGVDPEVIWGVVEQDLPRRKATVIVLLGA